MSDQTTSQPDPKPVPPEHHWKQQLLPKGKSGYPDPKSLANVIVTLRYAPDWKGVFALDEFSGEIMVQRCPPYLEDDKFKVHRLSHYDHVKTTAALEWYGLDVTEAKVINAIKAAAEENRIHPARDYFNALKWDGEPRLVHWLKDYLKAREQDAEYLAAVGTKWMVAGVKRVFEPGCKFDTMMVLEGAQGIGKSRALRALATFGHDEPMEYFTDALRFENITHPSSIAAMQGKLIIEFAELAGMSRKEIEDIKNWITIQTDELQRKYENPITQFPRQFILAGTTNDDAWLRDPSGNRRFLPVKCCDYIDIDSLNQDKEQLWAEAVYLYHQKYPIHFEHDSIAAKIAESEQKMRLAEDPWTDAILGFVSRYREVRTPEIMSALEIDPQRRDEVAQRRIGRVMRANGWVRTKKWTGGKTTNVWINPDLKADAPPKTGDLKLEGAFGELDERDGD